MMFHNAHATKFSFYVTLISCDIGVAKTVCMILSQMCRLLASACAN